MSIGLIFSPAEHDHSQRERSSVMLAALNALLCRCEAFSTYPRTYDLLHAWTVFSDTEKKGCSGEDLLLEIDRILRPTGFVIIRDKQHVIEFVKKHLSALHWEAVGSTDSTSDPEQDNDEIILIVQKKLWLTSESIRDTE